MALRDYGIIIRTPDGEIITGDWGFKIPTNNPNVFVAIHKGSIYVEEKEGKIIKSFRGWEQFFEKKGKLREFNVEGTTIIMKCLDKYSGCCKFQTRVNDYIVEHGYGLPNSKEEFIYLSTKKREYIHYDNDKTGEFKKRLSKNKRYPYGWTRKDIRYYKKYFI